MTGRTKDLMAAIRAHASPGNKQFPPSESNQVIAKFEALKDSEKDSEKQDLLNFLRGL